MLTQLEMTIINEAQGYLAEVLLHYSMDRAGIANAEDQSDLATAKAGLSCLLELAHRVDSGMGPEAIQLLLELENKEKAAVPG
jgi:hypothetical protein